MSMSHFPASDDEGKWDISQVIFPAFLQTARNFERENLIAESIRRCPRISDPPLGKEPHERSRLRARRHKPPAPKACRWIWRHRRQLTGSSRFRSAAPRPRRDHGRLPKQAPAKPHPRAATAGKPRPRRFVRTALPEHRATLWQAKLINGLFAPLFFLFGRHPYLGRERRKHGDFFPQGRNHPSVIV